MLFYVTDVSKVFYRTLDDTLVCIICVYFYKKWNHVTATHSSIWYFIMNILPYSGGKFRCPEIFFLDIWVSKMVSWPQLLTQHGPYHRQLKWQWTRFSWFVILRRICCHRGGPCCGPQMWTHTGPSYRSWGTWGWAGRIDSSGWFLGVTHTTAPRTLAAGPQLLTQPPLLCCS